MGFTAAEVVIYLENFELSPCVIARVIGSLHESSYLGFAAVEVVILPDS